MKNDIQNREDLLKLVTEFYVKLLNDPSISYIFTDVAKIHLEEHLPVLVDFWEMVVFHSDTYRKNAMQPHLHLHRKTPFQKHHFETWLNYFTTTVDELFEGNNAFVIKERATSIATMMQVKTMQVTEIEQRDALK